MVTQNIWAQMFCTVELRILYAFKNNNLNHNGIIMFHIFLGGSCISVDTERSRPLRQQASYLSLS